MGVCSSGNEEQRCALVRTVGGHKERRLTLSIPDLQLRPSFADQHPDSVHLARTACPVQGRAPCKASQGSEYGSSGDYALSQGR